MTYKFHLNSPRDSQASCTEMKGRWSQNISSETLPWPRPRKSVRLRRATELRSLALFLCICSALVLLALMQAICVQFAVVSRLLSHSYDNTTSTGGCQLAVTSLLWHHSIIPGGSNFYGLWVIAFHKWLQHSQNSFFFLLKIEEKIQ